MRLVPILVYLAAALPLTATNEWRFTQRDVYLDGSLDRAAVVYRIDEPLRVMVVPSAGHRVFVLDEDAHEARTIERRDIETSNDLTSAWTNARPSRAKGLVTHTADGVISAHVGRVDLVVAGHESTPGPLEPGILARDYPVWAALKDAHEADGEAVARLKAVMEPTDVTVVFATWCGDSRREVPRLLRSLEVASNPNLRVHLFGLGSDFDPLDFIQERHVINVPTIIVERDGAELGRIVETPATGVVERDLADIMSGTPQPHEGRWERQQQVASGSYALTWDDGRHGTETWRLFSTKEGGQLAHSVIDDGILVREVWHRVDAAGQTTFVEVTDRAGDVLRRTRYRFRDGVLRAYSRGSSSGIVDQTIAMPEDCSIVTGSVATAGWSCRLPDSGGETKVHYTLPLDASSIIGTTRNVSLDRSEIAGGERLGMPVRAEHVRASDQIAATDLWIDSELGVPLRLDGDGLHAELVTLDL